MLDLAALAERLIATHALRMLHRDDHEDWWKRDDVLEDAGEAWADVSALERPDLFELLAYVADITGHLAHVAGCLTNADVLSTVLRVPEERGWIPITRRTNRLSDPRESLRAAALASEAFASRSPGGPLANSPGSGEGPPGSETGTCG
ncbi:hypothetical protein [Blastococcus capsensis]|uniref:hypothetical protein n=1 Tax=Blastococcus capsensis TaxID=1564163 RepID=UPI002541CCB7|nr:hypothetical protein [Blastococcus capsensis]MDK3258916.1 hypothetical protein [Blastococcus capsensis]